MLSPGTESLSAPTMDFSGVAKINCMLKSCMGSVGNGACLVAVGGVT